VTAYVYRDPRHRKPPEHSTEARVAKAITNPDTVTPRRQYEALQAWQVRAVLDVIAAAIRAGKEPFAGLRDDAVAAGREDERKNMIAVLRARAGDGMAQFAAEILEES